MDLINAQKMECITLIFVSALFIDCGHKFWLHIEILHTLQHMTYFILLTWNGQERVSTGTFQIHYFKPSKLCLSYKPPCQSLSSPHAIPVSEISFTPGNCCYRFQQTSLLLN